jgi:hypothetical protein
MAKIGTTSEISIDSSVFTQYRVISSAPDIVGIFAEMKVSINPNALDPDITMLAGIRNQVHQGEFK